MMLGSVKVRGIGLGTAGVLFAGIITGSFSKPIDHATLDFVKEFGLILFVFPQVREPASTMPARSRDAVTLVQALVPKAFRTCAEWRSACTHSGYDSCSA